MNNQGWIELFDGCNLKHWHSDQETDAWTAADGLLTCRKTGVLIFSTGKAKTLRDFELEMEVLTPPDATGSVRFHAAQSSRVTDGLEVVISARQGDHCQAGSLGGLRPVYKRLADETEWFTLRIAVSGKSVRVWRNDALLVDYVEPARPAEAGIRSFLGEGSFALCCNSELSPRFRRIRLRRLPEIIAEQQLPEVDETYRRVMACHRAGIPVIDLHVHLKGGLTLEQTLAKSRRDGIAHGIAVNCGKGFPVQNDAAAMDFCSSLGGAPVFAAMQAEGREWMQMFSHHAAASFDYIFTDSMTWSDNRGRRMRLWIPEEVGEIANPDEFMETLVARAVAILEGEPIDIYVNPTFLPAVLAADYLRLWTEARMSRVIEAAARNHVAIELNDLYRLPSERFVCLAKAAGCKFTLGTNNTGLVDLRRCEYGLEIVERCALRAQDFFVPGAGQRKAVERKGHLLQR